MHIIIADLSDLLRGWRKTMSTHGFERNTRLDYKKMAELLTGPGWGPARKLGLTSASDSPTREAFNSGLEEHCGWEVFTLPQTCSRNSSRWSIESGLLLAACIQRAASEDPSNEHRFTVIGSGHGLRPSLRETACIPADRYSGHSQYKIRCAFFDGLFSPVVEAQFSDPETITRYSLTDHLSALSKGTTA